KPSDLLIRTWQGLEAHYDPESTDSKLLSPVSSSLFIGLCVLVESGPLATLVINVHFKPLTIAMSPNDLKQIMVISTGFQLMAQTRKPSADLQTDSIAVRTKSHEPAFSKDQAIPSDLAVTLSGKETDVDAFVNVSMEGLNVAISVESRTIISAAINGIALDLTKRTFDMAISFSVHQMFVEECLSKTKFILSYTSTASNLLADSNLSHFIMCRYLQKNRVSSSLQEVDHFVELYVG
ncbi:hypothetical protein BVRB_030760, partial [Beta vulgaris subsp. vulgaris]